MQKVTTQRHDTKNYQHFFIPQEKAAFIKCDEYTRDRRVAFKNWFSIRHPMQIYISIETNSLTSISATGKESAGLKHLP